MKKTKKILCLVLVLIMCFSVVPMTDLGIEASASSNIIINGTDIGYASGDYFTKNGKSCATTAFSNGRCHKNGICTNATDSRCNCMRYWPSYPNYQVDLKASQCFGFARYCQWKVYGYHDGSSSSKFSNLTGTVSSSNCTASNLKTMLKKCSPATHIRTGDGEHSIVIISANDDGVKVSDCNSNGYCIIKTYSYTWATFATYLKGRSGISYANSAKDSGQAAESLKEYPFEATFEVTASSKTIKELPYSSSSTIKTIAADDEISVVAYLYNKYGNLWYKTSSGNYIHSNYLEVVENDSLPPSNYLNAKFKVMCSEKSVKNEPLSSSETIRTIYKNEILNVIGYLYNEYDNLWYILEDGGYVPHHYFSVVSSNIRTPSNYFNENLIARANKPIKSAPYSSAEEVGRTTKDAYVNIDGYLYNRYGNLWYMTSDKYFVLFSFLEQPNESSQAPSNHEKRDFIAETDKQVKNDPYNVAEKIKTISKGNTISTIGYVINLYGNKWYYDTEGYYIYPSNLTCVHAYTSSTTKEATCSTTGIKTFTCNYCGDQYTKTISKTAHNSNTTIPAVAATCTKTGLTEGKKCSVCGTVTVAQQTVAKKSHNSNTIIPSVSATCKATGLTEGKKCSVCGTITVAQQTVAKKSHIDNNGDYKCDYGCGYAFQKPAPDTPSTPDEPENKPCSCNCHKGGISGFFFKIINFFEKLFGKNKVCACGVKH